jgi:hypothetical protein
LEPASRRPKIIGFDPGHRSTSPPPQA